MNIIVSGKMIPLNEVQEEDQRNMTTDEYKVNQQQKIGINQLFLVLNSFI